MPLIVGLDYRPATVAPQSGIGRQVLALEQALVNRADTELLRFTEAALADERRSQWLCPPWPAVLEGLQRPHVRLRFEARFLPVELARRQVAIYIATANMGLPLTLGRGSTRYVLLLHDLFQLTERNHHRSRFKAWTYRLLDSLSIAWSVWRADLIWCPSRFSANEAARLFPRARDKLRVLPNLVAPVRADSVVSLPALPERYWLAVGTREPRKNMPRFVQCWQRAREQFPGVPELVLLGHADDLSAELRSLTGLHWLTGVSDAQLQGVYRQAECLWQPSFAEGFGLPVIEALAQGTPVAVASGSALDEVAPPESPRFAPADGQQILACMQILAAKPQARDQASQLAWAEGFGPEAYQVCFESLMQELLR